jgi:hypothetical protein
MKRRLAFVWRVNLAEFPFQRLSKRGRRSLKRNTTEHPKASFALRIPAKPTLYALRMHLFGQSLHALGE